MLFTHLLFSIALQVFCSHVQGTLVKLQNIIKADGGNKQRVGQGNDNSEVGATACFGQHVFYGKDNEKHCFGPELDKNLKPVKHELKNLGMKGNLRLRRDGKTTTEANLVNDKEEKDDQDVQSEEDETGSTKSNTSVDVTAKPVDTTIPSGVSAEEEGCPTSCPPGDMMVCGRCQHDRYHTYLSACHMRMHACKYPHHVVHLISRHPCGQFGPMNTEFNVRDGKIYQPMEQGLPQISGYN